MGPECASRLVKLKQCPVVRKLETMNFNNWLLLEIDDIPLGAFGCLISRNLMRAVL